MRNRASVFGYSFALFAVLGLATTAFASETYWVRGNGVGSERFWASGNGVGSEHFWRSGNGVGSEHFWRSGNGAGSEHYWRSGTGVGSEYYWRSGTGMGSEHYWRSGNGPGSEHYWRSGTGPSIIPELPIGVRFALLKRMESCAKFPSHQDGDPARNVKAASYVIPSRHAYFSTIGTRLDTRMNRMVTGLGVSYESSGGAVSIYAGSGDY
ncbi:MAG: hypothetical protein ABII00_11885, partial [Elusimicrobiota bacterium]